jgi:hypothetical protein
LILKAASCCWFPSDDSIPENLGIDILEGTISDRSEETGSEVPEELKWDVLKREIPHYRSEVEAIKAASKPLLRRAFSRSGTGQIQERRTTYVGTTRVEIEIHNVVHIMSEDVWSIGYTIRNPPSHLDHTLSGLTAPQTVGFLSESVASRNSFYQPGDGSMLSSQTMASSGQQPYYAEKSTGEVLTAW